MISLYGLPFWLSRGFLHEFMYMPGVPGRHPPEFDKWPLRKDVYKRQDQGHIPLKTVGCVYDRDKQAWKALEGVNGTRGFPIIRTSVDHGTGFALAGKGTSNELSLVNAIDYAVRMAKGRSGNAGR